MRFLRYLSIFLLPLALLTSVCFGQQQPASSPSVLPKAFGGWQIAGAAHGSYDPTAADSANAALLKEYGFTGLTTATYTRDDGRTLTIKAARFQDASGAYGAFTFYRTPQMHSEEIGNESAAIDQRVLFYHGNMLVDAVFQRLSAMSASELRELADDLPKAAGSEANPPDLPTYLPKTSYVKNTAKYVVGPVGLEQSGAPLPAQYINFNRGAEVVLGDYSISGNTGRLTLIGYPTPQIAANQLKEIESAQQAHQVPELPTAIRRTGRIVVLASGNISGDVAHTLASAVNYEAEVTWNQNTFHDPHENVGRVVLGVMLLAAIVCGMSIVAGMAFGGFRLVIKRLLPGKVFDRPEQVEIIALHLSDSVPEPGDSSVSSSIKAG